MLTKDGEDDDDDDTVVGVSNRHKIGPAKSLSKVTDTDVPPLAYPTKGDTVTCNRPEGLMVMFTEWMETSAPLLLDIRSGTTGEPLLLLLLLLFATMI